MARRFARIETERLILVPATVELAEAQLRGREALGELLDADVPNSWPPPLENRETMRWTRDHLRRDPEGTGWYAWFVLEKSGSRPHLVGTAGFKGRPNADGVVELGYAIIHTAQGCGYATEATAALVEWAFRHDDARRVVADTLPDLVTSIRVLAKLGFAGPEDAPEPGVIRFRLDRGPAVAART